MMTSPPPPEVIDLTMRLIASHTDLFNAVACQDRDKALRATKEAALLGMRFLGIMPTLNELGVKSMTAEEMVKLKKNLNSLLS